MYKLSRTKFINWICTSCFFEREGSRIKDDLIKGSEFTAEFNNIVTAIASKVDNNQVLTNVPANAIFTANDFTGAYVDLENNALTKIK